MNKDKPSTSPTPLKETATQSFSALYRMSKKRDLEEDIKDGIIPGPESKEAETNKDNIPNDKDKLLFIEVDKIVRNEKQPRFLFKDDTLDDLINSIREKGVEVPIKVFPIEDGQFKIIYGERRWRASKSLDLKTIPAIVQQAADDQSVFTSALIENIQRENLHYIEQAKAFKKMMEEGYAKTHADVAKLLGISRPAVQEKIKITELPEEILDLIINIPQISLNHAIQLTQISSNLDLCKQLIKQMATTEISRDALKKIIENKLHGTRHKASFNPFDYKPHSKGFNLEVKYRKDRPEDRLRVIQGLEEIISKLKGEIDG
jgi:ParB family chromosome partitioning protein